MLVMAQSYMILEEKFNTQLDNPIFANTNSNHSARKESHRRKYDSDRGMQGLYEKYTSLNSSQEKIYQHCGNIEFSKWGVWSQYPITESSQTDKLRYFHFHKGHNHNTDDYI